MKITPFRVLLCIGLLIVGFVGWFVYQLFGPSPRIVVSKQTTWLTSPMADDGLPDYAKWLLDRQREGVTPENNAAIPFLQAMWPAELSPQYHKLVCDEIGMPVPTENGIIEPDFDFQQDDSVQRGVILMLLAKQGIEPPEPIKNNNDFQMWKENWVPEPEPQEDRGELVEEGLFEEPVEDEWDEFGEMGGYGGYDDTPFGRAEEDAVTLFGNAHSDFWTAEQLPPLADWIKRNEHNFELLHEAAGRPKYYCPSPSLLEDPKQSFVAIMLSDIQSMRGAANALSMRAMFHGGQGDFTAAWEDIRAMYLLADHLPAETLVGQLVRIAIWGIADAKAEQLFAASDLPIDVARSMHDFYQSRQPVRDMHLSIDEGERLFSVTAILEFSGQRTPNEGAFSADDWGMGEQFALISRVSVDWDLVLIRLNAIYDAMAEAMAIEDFQERQQALAQVDAQWQNAMPTPGTLAGGLVSQTARSEAIAGVLGGLLLPAVSSAGQAEDRAHAKLILMKTAAALAVYQRAEGEYPESLDALVPDLLPQFPTDNFTGARLSYTKTSNGYLLVNIGANGNDDGGMNSTMQLYKGYSVGYHHAVDDESEFDAIVCDLLGEPLPGSDKEGVDAENDEEVDPNNENAPAEADDELFGDEVAEEDEMFEDDLFGGGEGFGGVDEPLTLTGKIPADADDWAIRLPLVPADWSALEEKEDDK